MPPSSPGRWPGYTTTAVTFLMIALILTGILGWALGVSFGGQVRPIAPVVPPNPNVPQHPKLPENGPGEIELQSDLSIFDLRFWRPVSPGTVLEPISPVNYSNYLRLVKRKKVNRLYAHYATSGLRIDLQCVTHPYSVERQVSAPPHLEDKEYAAAIDISREPVGKVFLVVIQATYWNGFRGASEEDASTYTDKALPVPSDLSLLILFPRYKPCHELKLYMAHNPPDDEPAQWVAYPDVSDAYREPTGQYAYWSIRNKQPDHHYRITWSW